MPDSQLPAPMNYDALPPAHGGRTGLAIAALVLGIFAFLLSFVVVGSLFALVALLLGLIHIIRRRGPPAMAWWGVGLALVAIPISIGMAALFWKGFREIKKTIAELKSNANWMNGADDWEGVVAPDFSATTPDGKVIRLSDLKGKRVVLNFWSTWWQPCLAELPHLSKLRSETSPEEVVIIGVGGEDPETLGNFARKHGVNYLVASATNMPAPFKEIQQFPTTYFIDRKGIIQSVSVGTNSFETLKQNALAADFAGSPKDAPGPGPSDLEESDHPLTASPAWMKTVAGAQALCIGDWDEDGQPDILVAGASRLHVFGLDGVEKKSIALPGNYAQIAFGKHKEKGPRLAGYTTWQQKISVIDRTGKEIWSYKSSLGVNGAHWGDLDGDGTDELVAGMNGFGGLHAVSADGQLLWKVNLPNVWSQAVIPAGPNRGALVLATEAGGSVKVYDDKGKLLRTLKPNNQYCSQLAAFCMDTNLASGTLQGLAGGQGKVVAFETGGAVLWSTPSFPGATPQSGFACGDIDGDGTKEWAVPDAGGNVLLVNTSGETLCTVTNISPGQLEIVADKDGRGLLLTLAGTKLTAYSFKP